MDKLRRTYFFDDRITCFECTKYVKKSCMAAENRERMDVAQRYKPIPDSPPHRCVFFLPSSGLTGKERWPELWAEYRERFKIKTGQERIEQMRELIA